MRSNPPLRAFHIGSAIAVLTAVALGITGALLPWATYAGGYSASILDLGDLDLSNLLWAAAYVLPVCALIPLAILVLALRSRSAYAAVTTLGAVLFVTWIPNVVNPLTDSARVFESIGTGGWFGLSAGLVALGAGSAGMLFTSDRQTHAAAQPGLPATPPAGWYPDPAGGGGARWWTGQAWTTTPTTSGAA
jgi:ABC-type branched-subunit amino acid transport system permease subunit